MTANDVNNDTEQKVKKIIAESLEYDIDKITLDSKIGDDLGADSLDQVELMMGFEEHFGCEIPDEDASKLDSVRKIVEYIEKRQLQI